MFKKFIGKIKQGTVEDVKGVIKKEAAKCADDILPTVVGIASLILIFLAAIPPQKAAPSTITINNYYYKK